MFHWSNFGGIFYKRWELTVTEGTNKNGQSRNTGNIGHTRYRTIQKYWQHWAHKIQDNPEILATLGTQDTGRRRTKNKKTHNTSKKTKKMNNTVPSKKGG
jgi:hypothetical protein